MRKVIGLLAVLVLTLSLCGGLFGCDDGTPDKEFDLDYAKDVYLKTEKYPQLEDQGLFFIGWDEQTNMPVEARASSAEGKALADPNKPTIFFVHGWLNTVPNAHKQHIITYLNPELVEAGNWKADEYAADGNIYWPKFWLDAGWNVGSFYYNRYAVAMIFEAEENIYFGGHMAYKDNDGVISEYDSSDYSISQFFAAEYIRMLHNMGSDMGDKEIRLAGHSLGGITTVVTANLLYELSKEGQLEAEQVPSRLALLDTYITFDPKLTKLTAYFPDTTPISASGKQLVQNDKGRTYLSYLQNLTDAGVVSEMYLLDTESSLNSMRVPCLSCDGRVLQVMDYTASVIYTPRPCAANMMGSGHNAVYEMYMTSIRTGIALDDGEEGISALASKKTLTDNRGKIFRITEGDDAFDLAAMSMEQTDKADYGCNVSEPT